MEMVIDQKMTLNPADLGQARSEAPHSQSTFGLWQSIQIAIIVSYAFTYTVPLLSVVAGFLATYMIISLTQRGFVGRVALVSALTVGLGVAFGATGFSFGARLVFLCWGLLPALVFGSSWSMTHSVSKTILALALTVTALVAALFAMAGDTVYQIINIQEAWIYESAPSISSSLSGVFSSMRWILPALIAMTIATPAFCAWMIVITKNEPETRRSFVDWRLARPTLWFAFLTLLVRFAAQFAGQDLIMQICDNALLVLLIAFSVTGLFVMEYLFRHFKLHIALRVIIYTLLVITLHIGGAALALAGMLDTLINFRDRLEPSQAGNVI